MIYFLIVVAVGGTSSITGPLLAALLLGMADVAGKYFIPRLGAFHCLFPHDRHPDLAPPGPVRAQGGKR
jgi:ABC-type branched-subunit amino acid transport system permease subunit